MTPAETARFDRAKALSRRLIIDDVYHVREYLALPPSSSSWSGLPFSPEVMRRIDTLNESAAKGLAMMAVHLLATETNWPEGVGREHDTG